MLMAPSVPLMSHRSKLKWGPHCRLNGKLRPHRRPKQSRSARRRRTDRAPARVSCSRLALWRRTVDRAVPCSMPKVRRQSRDYLTSPGGAVDPPPARAACTFSCWTTKSRFWQHPHVVRNRIRSAAAALLFLGCLVTLTSAFNWPNRSPDSSSRLDFLSMAAKPAQQPTTVTLADRVAYQRAIEEVYWRHRIWPKERPDPKPSLDEVMPSAQLEKKVEDYLRNSEALEDYWQQPLSAEQLQAEMERMAMHTKQPEVLRELFEALGNNPFVIAECLARPALAERLLTNWYAYDQRIHGELKQHAEADLFTHPTIEQLKQSSGTYSEIEFVKNDSAHEEANRRTKQSVKLNSREWDENIERLASQFQGQKIVGQGRRLPGEELAAGAGALQKAAPHVGTTGRDAWSQIKTGVLTPLQEDRDHYYASAVVNKSDDQLKLATVSWPKEPLESWLSRAESQVPKAMSAAGAGYTLPDVLQGSGGCIDDTWTATAGPPVARSRHTAVWTGSEMIIWGGYYVGVYGVNTGGRYNPSTDNWTPTSTVNAPEGRSSHTAVWTGSEMIVWGGTGSGVSFNTGGRYNPSTDSWTATSTVNVPSSRYDHTAVLTGSAIIVWGGYDGTYLNTGGKYNPTTDSWTATSTLNAPDARAQHTAVWTATEMIVWGGWVGVGNSSILAGDTILARIVGPVRTRLTRLPADTRTQQPGPEAK